MQLHSFILLALSAASPVHLAGHASSESITDEAGNALIKHNAPCLIVGEKNSTESTTGSSSASSTASTVTSVLSKSIATEEVSPSMSAPPMTSTVDYTNSNSSNLVKRALVQGGQQTLTVYVYPNGQTAVPPGLAPITITQRVPVVMVKSIVVPLAFQVSGAPVSTDTTYVTSQTSQMNGVFTIAAGLTGISTTPTITTVITPPAAQDTNVALAAGQVYQAVQVPGGSINVNGVTVQYKSTIIYVIDVQDGMYYNQVQYQNERRFQDGQEVIVQVAVRVGIVINASSAAPPASTTVATSPTSTSSSITMNVSETATGTTIATPTGTPTITFTPTATGPDGQEIAIPSSFPLVNQPQFVQAMLEQHNSYRARNRAPPLTWDTTLASYALERVNTRVFAHVPGNPYGENLAIGSLSNPLYYVYLFYDEINQYNFSNPGFSEATGHFTQLVWLSSQRLGCAMINDNTQSGFPYYLACEYAPAGNVDFAGQPGVNYRNNVLEPVGPFPSQPKMNL